jgi:hypothetical protein
MMRFRGKGNGTRRNKRRVERNRNEPYNDPELLVALEALLDPHTIGDPMRPLRWTCKSSSGSGEVGAFLMR